jgi:hypothetical protein
VTASCQSVLPANKSSPLVTTFLCNLLSVGINTSTNQWTQLSSGGQRISDR